LREAGLSTRSFYRHFQKKQDLLMAVLDTELDQAAQWLRTITTTQDTPPHRVRRYLDATLDMAYSAKLNKPSSLFAQHWRELLVDYPDQMKRARVRMIEPLQDVIEAGVATGDFPDARPYEDSVAIFMLIAGISADAAMVPGSQPREKLERIVYPFCERALGGSSLA
jgi:AcrR family transcriptional regulator